VTMLVLNLLNVAAVLVLFVGTVALNPARRR